MSRISLVEQYDNRSVIEQIHSLKNDVEDATATAVEASANASAAITQVTPLVPQVEQALAQVSAITSTVNSHTGAINTLNQKTGDPQDTASSTGTLYARSKKNAGDISTLSTTVSTQGTDVSNLKTAVGTSADSPSVSGSLYARTKANTQGVSDNADAIEAIEQELPAYQLKAEKNQASGYAGLDANGRLPNTKLYTGVTLDSVLTAGAQLLDGEMLYIYDGKVKSRPITLQGATYQGRYSSVAGLPGGVANGDYAAVYGSQGDDGFYTFSATAGAWQKTLIFDATSYQLVSNISTTIDTQADDSHYPSTLAVKNYHNATEVDDVDVTLANTAGGITATVDIANPNGQVIASGTGSLATDAAPISGSVKPIQSGAVYTGLAGKQDTLNSTQLGVLSSGITAAKVSAYDAYDTEKQDALSTTQLNACNSGITSAKVTTYDGYQAQINAKEPALNTDQKRKITISTADPTGGSDGDVWLVYE